MKHSFLLLVTASILSLYSCSDTSTAGKESASLNPDRVSLIDSTLLSAIEDKELHGCVGLVASGSKILYHRAFGYADIEDSILMEKNSIFRIASMSKAITTVGIMILYERGLCMLGDNLRMYIPEFNEPEVLISADSEGNVSETRPSNTPVRIINLMSHTSGISYPFAPGELKQVYARSGIIDGFTDKDLKLEDKMKILADLPLLFDPGSDFEYGLSTDVLGYLCEVISEKSLDDFLYDEIFTPLGMDDTYFYIPEEKEDRLVELYSFSRGNGIQERNSEMFGSDPFNADYPISGAKAYYSGGAGLSSTARDYSRFLRMLLNDGELDGKRILSRKSVELLTAPRHDLDDDGVNDYGLGFSVEPAVGMSSSLASEGTYSWGGAFNTSFWVDPAEDMVIVFMAQDLPSRGRASRQFKSSVYQALK